MGTPANPYINQYSRQSINNFYYRKCRNGDEKVGLAFGAAPRMLPGRPAAHLRACIQSRLHPQSSLLLRQHMRAQVLGSLSSWLQPGQFWVLQVGSEPLDGRVLCLFQKLFLLFFLVLASETKPEVSLPLHVLLHKGALPPQCLSV